MENQKLFRPHKVGVLTTGIHVKPIGLTEKQSQRLDELIAKESKSKELFELIERRDKIPESKLSEGAKTYVENVFYQNHFGWKKSINSKYLEKGIIKEDKSISQLCKYLGLFGTKNEKSISNDWIEGTPDIIFNKPKLIVDVKNAYYPDGLKFFQDDISTREYEYQIHCYNWIKEYQHGMLARILMSLDGDLLMKEAYDLWKKSGNEGKPTDEFIEEVRQEFDFESKIKLEDRINLKYINTTDENIDILKKSIELGTEYYNTLEDKLKTSKNSAMEVLNKLKS